jgi:hypothetical protein
MGAIPIGSWRFREEMKIEATRNVTSFVLVAFLHIGLGLNRSSVALVQSFCEIASGFVEGLL